ncbi:ankyrin repeat domain-containing protein [Legionella jordanis]|uniref:Ankyrin repeat-containing protein n=1 Tax=Legionella jordanis TaxID=456 RepID=A0A0W0VC95_9GAMM|nr:ankyrin repeat domain-containing protein [Legionella jordanis]KTD17735.1 ankyrin repeat-containing protein [Legionella jordanis]VEH11331.1 ankyrin repeat-containing protein [Legionella jordanis]
MYYFYILIVGMAVIILYQVVLRQSFFQRAYASRSNRVLSHHDLLDLISRFHYVRDNGVCFGFTLTWAQDAALDYDDAFYQRLNIIKNQKQDLPHKLSQINHKIKFKKRIRPQEDELLEIGSFLDALCLAQTPGWFPDIYASHLTQTSINQILSMIASRLAANKQVFCAFRKVFSFPSPLKLLRFIEDLHELLNNEDNIAMLISSEEHTTGFKKLQKDWLFIDINYLYGQRQDRPYLVLNHQELCQQLYLSFKEKEQIVFNIDFISADSSSKLTTRLHQLHNRYPVLYQHMTILNNRNLSALVLAAQNGEEETLREIIRLSKKTNFLTELQFSAAFVYAMANQQWQAVRHLLRAPNLDINLRCGAKKETPLALACRQGHYQIAKEILNMPGVEVDAVNCKQLTPLMLACRSKLSKENRELFRLLLAKGASLKSRNLNQEDPLTIARKHHNQAAILVIEAHLAVQTKKTRPIRAAMVNRNRTGSTGHSYHFFPKGDSIARQDNQAHLSQPHFY